MQKKTKIIIALSIIPQVIIVKTLARYPEFVEKYYSQGLYPFISKLFRYLLGWLPFSFGDILYALAIVMIVRFLIKNGKKFFSSTRSFFTDVFVGVSLVYFIFHLLWGMNYYRLPLYQSLGISPQYTTEELLAFTDILIEKNNTLHTSITKNDTIPVKIPHSLSEVFKKTPEGYAVLSKRYPQLEYKPKSIKKSLFSYPLTYMGFSGYLNPFTQEGHVDYMIPGHKFPTTSCHEEAHQLGYSAENEANFLGYLASINNEDQYFKYSGYTFALRHCLNEISRREPELIDSYLEKVNPGILKNYEEARMFWRNHQNVFEPLFKLTFNTYLKANSQSAGIKSYNHVVALLVNYYKTEPL